MTGIGDQLPIDALVFRLEQSRDPIDGEEPEEYRVGGIGCGLAEPETPSLGTATADLDEGFTKVGGVEESRVGGGPDVAGGGGVGA